MRKHHSACRIDSNSSAFARAKASRSAIASTRSSSSAEKVRTVSEPIVTAPIRSPRRVMGMTATPCKGRVKRVKSEAWT